MTIPQLDRIESKLDRLDERVDSVDVTLAAQHATLKEHIRRTEALENQIEPLRRQSAMVAGAIKIAVWAGGIAGTVVTAIQLLGKK